MRRVDTPQSYCLFGLAHGDITPPVGMDHRTWGAAAHDVSTGVHRPLSAFAMAFEPAPYGRFDSPGARASARRIVVVLDLAVLYGRTMAEVLRRVEESAGLPPGQVQITMTHTHSTGLLDITRAGAPGGHLIRPYLDHLVEQIVAIVRQAIDALRPTWIVYGAGRCDLAANRDYWDDEARQYVCGFNPTGPADDTVLVARFSDEHGRTTATLINYACHPTTLAWQNSLISPDFPGIARDVAQSATGAPCVFLQGASGDLGPREGYVGDLSVVERNGRCLAYSALAAMELLPPPATSFEYAGPVVSGTMLGTWRHVPLDSPSRDRKGRWQARTWTVDLPIRGDLEMPEGLQEECALWDRREDEARRTGRVVEAQTARAEIEQRRRKLVRLSLLPQGDFYPLHVALWQIGDAFWVAVAAEEYQCFQRTLRERFHPMPVVVMTLVNSSLPSYLPSAATYGKGIYQENIALLACGSLETLTDEIGRQIEAWRDEYRG